MSALYFEGLHENIITKCAYNRAKRNGSVYDEDQPVGVFLVWRSSS